MRIESYHQKYLQCSTHSIGLHRTAKLLSQLQYNFEILKLQFVALLSPHPRCHQKTYPRPHGITIKIVPIPAVIPR